MRKHTQSPGDGVDHEAQWLDLLAEARELRTEFKALRDSRAGLVAALETAAGHLMNARIDLETGATKQAAIRTIETGLKVVRAAIKKAAIKKAAS